MTEIPAGRTIGRRTLFTIFTLSGFSGLIYESIWSHYLKLFLGHAAYAQTLVLTVFMGGMALGAWLAARYSPKMRNLLLGYALVELVTGAIALLFHPIYLGSTGFTFETVIPALDSPTVINAAKWLIAALLILPQSVLLGSTFPLISGAVVRRFPDRPGTTLAMLYFTNSLGAALGVLTSGFLFIGWVGLPGTVVIAGLMNIAIATYVWRNSGREPEPPTATVTAPASADRLLARIILVAAFASGAAAFIYEIAWIRMLSLVLGSSTHAFELMLSAFIFGLAFGGLWIRRRIDSLPNPLATLATLFALMAFLAACTLPAYGYTFDIIGAAVRGFERTEAGYRNFNLVSHGVAAMIMIPTTFIAGMTLPIMTHTLLRRADERAIGRVYASNTVGAIAGVLIAVHLLLPGIGVKGAVITGAIVQLAIAILFATQQMALSQRPRQVVLAASGVLVVLIALFVHLDPMRMASGVYRNGTDRLPEGLEVPFLRDGKTSTISLVRGGDIVSIATNGKPDAAINMAKPGHPHGDEITMVMAGVLPLALHPRAREIANIGIGSGLTSQVVLSSPDLERLDSIEIEPVIAEAARLGFGPRVKRLFEDPRSKIYFEDAKTFFAAAKTDYDIIISEPSNPWVSGVASLFSEEFYAQVVRHLKPGGLMVQWIQIYETDLTVVGSIMKALGQHFEDYVVYGTDNSNILIVASPKGMLPPLQHDLFEVPSIAAEMRLTGLQSMGDIEIRRIGNKRMLGALMRTMPLPANSDFHPYVDLNAARMRFMRRDALGIIELAMLPVPFAEIFGEPLVMSTSESEISAGFFTRHRLAIESRVLIRALESNDFSGLAPTASKSLNGLRASATDCKDATVRRAWLDAVHALASSTTPYLTRDERKPLWKAVREQGCVSELAENEAAWLGLIETCAGGDAAAIAAQGEILFTGDLPTLKGTQLLEALISTAAAKSATGNNEDATALLRAFLPDLKDPGEYGLALRLVMSHASGSESR